MSKVIIANWKMNPLGLAEAQQLFTTEAKSAEQFSQAETIICPPFVYIEELSKLVTGRVLLGAQDAFWEEKGAFTGEVSVQQLKEFGVGHILIGHSERRALGETDEIVNKKLLKVLESEMKAVLLIGEKEKGDYREDILIDQLSRGLAGVKPDQLDNLMVAYEPVWAISSHSGGISDTPESALEDIKNIKAILIKVFGEEADKIRMLYGGSVNPENVAGFLSHPEIEGAVVGGASLKPEQFYEILKIAAQ